MYDISMESHCQPRQFDSSCLINGSVSFKPGFKDLSLPATHLHFWLLPSKAFFYCPDIPLVSPLSLWEIGIDIYTLICIKWITNKNLLYKKKLKNKIKYEKNQCIYIYIYIYVRICICMYLCMYIYSHMVKLRANFPIFSFCTSFCSFSLISLRINRSV